MDKNVSKDKTYEFIVDYFTEEKVQSRYEWLYNLMSDYLQAEKIQDIVCISEDILNHVIIDYYVDIYRLKEFQDIETTHDSKIYAYLIAWIIRHKPLQIPSEDADKYAFVNEMFSVELLKSYLFKNPQNVSIVNVSREDMDNFVETLLYFFKYREYSAKSIEMIILAFEAGRAYQFSVDKAE